MSIRNTLAFVLVLPTLACTQVTTFANADHCSVNEGDRYCAELFPDKPYCIQGQGDCSIGDKYGCVEQVSSECHAPCGILGEAECMGMSSTGTDSETGSESESSASSESSTTGPMPCMGNEDCPDAGAPFCEPVSGDCVACDGTDDPDGACAGVDPGLPLCVGGACVACTAENPAACTGETPICDDATNSCVPCTEHGQCGEAACNLFTGACLPADAVVHVGGAMPDFATMNAAAMSFDMMTEGTIIVHAGAYNDQPVTVDGGRVLAFLAAEDTAMPPRWTQSSGGPPQLTVTDATVLMDGLQLSGNADDLGLRVDAGRAWLDRSRVVSNNGGGIMAENAAELVLRNCFVGQAVNNIDALSVDGASATVLYSTLVGAYNAAALVCATPMTVDVRNSILVTEGGTPPDEVDCPSALITYSATEGAVGGATNVAVDVFPSGMASDWFVDYTAGDYSLQNEGLTVFADIAQWTTGDPPTDIDGDPRPAVDGSPDYAGGDALP